MQVIDENGRTMTKREVIDRYLAAEKPYEVCVHTTMGSYMEFCRLERNIMCEDVAIECCNQYARLMHKNENFKGVCVRKNGHVIYETECKKEAK